MTYFKVNITKLDNLIDDYKTNKKFCSDNINSIYRSLGYTENAWNDKNSTLFIQKLKKDKSMLDDELDYLDDLIDVINTFKNNIYTMYTKYENSRNSMILKYDDKNFSSCKTYLKNSIEYINKAIEKLTVPLTNINYKYLMIINLVKKDLNVLKNNINSIINDINNINKSVNNYLESSSNQIKYIVNPNIKIDLLNYNWKNSYVNLSNSSIPMVGQKTAYTNKINQNFEESDLNTVVQNSNLQANSTLIKDDIINNNLNININNSSVAGKNIIKNNIENDKIFKDDAYIYSSKKEEIEEKLNHDFWNINDNSIYAKAKKTNINLDVNSKYIDNVSTYKSAEDKVNIDIKNESLDNIKNYMSSNSKSDLNMINDDFDSKKVNQNNVTSNMTNIQLDKTNNIKENVKSYESSKTNIDLGMTNIDLNSRKISQTSTPNTVIDVNINKG